MRGVMVLEEEQPSQTKKQQEQGHEVDRISPLVSIWRQFKRVVCNVRNLEIRTISSFMPFSSPKPIIPDPK